MFSFNPSVSTAQEGRVQADATVRNVRLIDVGVSAEASLVESAGYAPDPWKAYIEFEICHTLPEQIGPVQSNNILGFPVESMAVSHQSLTHQQLNIRHLIKQYSTAEKGDGHIARDRIIGCVVATKFPKMPFNGWEPGKSYAITAAAVIFKLAEGVNRILGDHISSRETQSVSIEATTSFGNMGVHRPSTGETWPLLDLPKQAQKSLQQVKGSMMPHIGKMDGEQLVLVYGMNGNPIALRGVGMTAMPAERAARIIGVQAERRDIGEDTMFCIAAERVNQVMVGSSVKFKSTGSVGRIVDVFIEGEASAPGVGFKLKATHEDPVVHVKLPDNRSVLRRYSDLK